MEYIFAFEPGDVANEVKRIDADPAWRPLVGDLIRFSDIPHETFRITRSIPSTNPETQNVTFIVEAMSDVEAIAGGSIAGFDQFYLDSQKT